MAQQLIFGVDVHPDYQRGLHWPTLYAQGYRYGAIKHTQGTGYRHNLTDEWVRDCRAAGLLAGAYHWLDASDGAAQARWFWKRVLECGGPKGMLIMLDVEDTGKAAQVTAWAREWNRLSGHHPFAIYTGGWWWRPNMGQFSGAAITPTLWHSSYVAADTDSIPDDPAALARRIPASWWTPGYGGWKRATFLQFSSRGDAGRLANNVDLNATWLSMEQLRAMAGLGPAGAPGETGGGIVPIPDGTPAPTQQGDDEVLRIVRQKGTGNYWVSNMIWRKPFKAEDLETVRYLMRTEFGQTNLDVEEPDRLDLYGDETTSSGGVLAVLAAIADRQQIDAYRLDAVLFDREATVGPEGSEYSGQANALHAVLEDLKGRGALADADLTRIVAAVETAVAAGVETVLSNASLDVTGKLRLDTPANGA